MSDQLQDLRELLLYISEKKEFNGNLELEHDCKVDSSDIKPLVKVINYIINFLENESKEMIYITLNKNNENITLVFTQKTDKPEMAEISSQVSDTLNDYKAKLEKTFKENTFIKILITFSTI
jgi:hypothetical protein